MNGQRASTFSHCWKIKPNYREKGPWWRHLESAVESIVLTSAERNYTQTYLHFLSQRKSGPVRTAQWLQWWSLLMGAWNINCYKPQRQLQQWSQQLPLGQGTLMCGYDWLFLLTLLAKTSVVKIRFVIVSAVEPHRVTLRWGLDQILGTPLNYSRESLQHITAPKWPFE